MPLPSNVVELPFTGLGLEELGFERVWVEAFSGVRPRCPLTSKGSSMKMNGANTMLSKKHYLHVKT